jgi:hypothetical protein
MPVTIGRLARWRPALAGALVACWALAPATAAAAPACAAQYPATMVEARVAELAPRGCAGLKTGYASALTQQAVLMEQLRTAYARGAPPATAASDAAARLAGYDRCVEDLARVAASIRVTASTVPAAAGASGAASAAAAASGASAAPVSADLLRRSRVLSKECGDLLANGLPPLTPAQQDRYCRLVHHAQVASALHARLAVMCAP